MKIIMYILSSTVLLCGLLSIAIGVIEIYNPSATFLGIPLCNYGSLDRAFINGFIFTILGVCFIAVTKVVTEE